MAYSRNGYEHVVLENEVLRMTVLPTRGAEISEFRSKRHDVDVLLHTARELPNLETYLPSTATDRDIFYDFYTGGWQECFPIGGPAGHYAGSFHSVHSEVCGLEWKWTVATDRANLIEVRFTVECRRTPFRLVRTVVLESNKSFAQLFEKIENTSPYALEYVWGHHPAFGAPFLSPACKIDLPISEVRTRLEVPDDRLKELRYGLKQFSADHVLRDVAGRTVDLTSAPPEQGGTMDNLQFELRGAGIAAIRNEALGLGVGLTWDAKVFPYLWYWESSHGGKGQPLWGREYLVALEPFNCPLNSGLVKLQGLNTLPTLQPFGCCETVLSVGFCRSDRPFKGEYYTI